MAMQEANGYASTCHYSDDESGSEMSTPTNRDLTRSNERAHSLASGNSSKVNSGANNSELSGGSTAKRVQSSFGRSGLEEKKLSLIEEVYSEEHRNTEHSDLKSSLKGSLLSE